MNTERKTRDTLQVFEVRLSPLRGVYASTCTYPVHFQSPVVNGCNLLDHRLHGRVHSGVEKKLALVRAFHMQLHHPVHLLKDTMEELKPAPE